jgi:predicted RNA-binding protein with RPS1 domain
MSLEIGSVSEGTVFKILKHGALVRFSEGDVGLVPISEIAYEYVRLVEDYLHEGDVISVKVTGVNDQGRYELSLKQLEPAPPGGRRGDHRVSTDLDDKLADFAKRSQQRMSEVRRREGRRRGGSR